MQIKIFTIPMLGGEALNDELNKFLRSKKVLQVENQMVSQAQGAFWSFCIKYLDEQIATDRSREKPDYKEILDEASFQRFAKLRTIRKQIAQEDAVPAYAVFTDEELAELAKISTLTAAKMQSVQGIGKKKVEKYGHHFVNKTADEKSQSPDTTDNGAG